MSTSNLKQLGLKTHETVTPQPSVLYAKFQNLTSKKSTVSLFHLFISHLKRHVWYSVAAGLAACKKWGHKLAMAWGHGMPWDKMGQPWKITIFPQQRKLMGSSAQNSSGVHWCRRRVRFNEVPEKVPMVPEKVWEGGLGAQIQQGSGEGPGEGSREGSRKPWCKSQVRSTRVPAEKVGEALVQGEVKFNRVPEKVWEALVQSQARFITVPEKVPEKVWEALVQSRVRFNKAPKKVPGGFGAEPGQVQQGSEDGSGDGLGGFGAEAGQVQQGPGEGSGEGVGAESGHVQQGSGEGSGEGSGRLWRRANTAPEKGPKKVPGSLGAKLSQFQWVPEKAWEALVHSQVRFNRVSEKVPEKVWEALVPEKVPGKVWEALVARSGSTGFRRRFRRRSGRPWFRRMFRGRCGRLWCRARSGSTGFRRRFRTRFREALVQSQVRFHRVPQNIPEKVVGSLGAKPSQVQRVPGKVAEAKPSEVHLTQGNLAEVFPALGFPARFRKIYKNKALRLLGIPPKLIYR